MLGCSVMSNCLRPHGLQPARLLCPWDSPGRDIGVGCHALLQGIFPTQGWKPGLLHCRRILYHLSPQGIPGNKSVNYQRAGYILQNKNYFRDIFHCMLSLLMQIISSSNDNLTLLCGHINFNQLKIDRVFS